MGQASYATAKAGITGLSKTLSKEWGRYHVTVNTVAFGYIKTRLTDASAVGNCSIQVGGRDIKVGINPDVLAALETQIPLGRPGTPDDGARPVSLFGTPEFGYISGQTLVRGGGSAG